MLCILRASLIYYAQIRLYLCICISFASLKQMLKNRSCSWNRSVVRLVDPCAAKGHNFFRPVWKDSNLLESVGMAEGSGLLAHDLQFKMHACGCRLWLRGPGPHLWAMPKPLVLSLFVTYLYDVSNNRDPENGIVWLQITMSQASASWSPCEHWPQRKPTWLCGFPSFNGEQPGSNPLTDRVVQGHWHFTSATLQAPCWTSILKIRSEPSNPRTKSPITHGLGPNHLRVFQRWSWYWILSSILWWKGKQKRPGPWSFDVPRRNGLLEDYPVDHQ